MVNVIAIGAHPDDVEFGCAGTLSKHLEEGDEVFVLLLTNGERGNHSSNREECLNSLKALGIKESNIIFGNFPDGYLTANMETIKFIEDYIKKLDIARVYTHSLNDRHQDHRNCSYAVSSAARKVPEIFLFPGPSTNTSFEPHYFIELSEKNLSEKINSLSFYKTQMEKGSIDFSYIKNLAAVHGKIGNVTYAEVFFINHLVRRGKNV